MNPMLNIAIRAARRAGNVIAKNYERRDDIQTSKKVLMIMWPASIKAAEAEIIEIIQKSYPDHTIISEERGALEGKDSDIQWVIDPLRWHNQLRERFATFLCFYCYPCKKPYRSGCGLRSYS